MRKPIPIKCKNRVFLAPMEEVNDIAFRTLCKRAGCGLTYTGMIHPLTQENLFLNDKPVLQLFTNSTKGIKEFMCLYDKKVSGWDFNLGCPAKNAKRKGFGVFMHHDLETIENILRIMRENTKKPLMIKIRKSHYTLEIIKIAEKYCDAICIHPRTQAQGYGGVPDLNYARIIKKKTKLPIIYSGNVNENNYKELLKEFDYVMMGRAAIGRPNIFSITSGKSTETIKKINFKDYLKLAEKYKLYFRQIKFQAMNFTKTRENAKELRLKIFNIKSPSELRKLISFDFSDKPSN